MKAIRTATAYERCIKEMFGLRRFGIKLGLGTIRRMMTGLGNPQDRFRTIHVAGTNGKGSVASALAAILTRAGFKTGLYTSPHLIRFNERILVDQEQITDARVVQAYREVRRVFAGDRDPTFFELTTAMALHEFGKRRIDWAVIETGMGGRLDATNMIRSSLAVITNISLEHKEYLGNSIAQIAGEKAGIIKPETPVVTGVRQPSAVGVLEKRAQTCRAPVYRLRRDFRVRRRPDGAFTYYGVDHTWTGLHTGLMGNHQIDNAALVLAGCEQLLRQGVAIPVDAIRGGLQENRWPGRLEVFSRQPYVILDGAHNLIAARNLAKFLAQNFNGRPITLVIGILNDKPYAAMLQSLLPLCKRVILTRPSIDRALSPETLLKPARDLVSDLSIVEDVPGAVARAVDSASDNSVICIAGSLYVVGEAKAALQGLEAVPGCGSI